MRETMFSTNSVTQQVRVAAEACLFWSEACARVLLAPELSDAAKTIMSAI